MKTKVGKLLIKGTGVLIGTVSGAAISNLVQKEVTSWFDTIENVKEEIVEVIEEEETL